MRAFMTGLLVAIALAVATGIVMSMTGITADAYFSTGAVRL